MYFKNEVIVEGRLTEKPEIKTNKNGKKYCFFTVCYNENHKQPDGNWNSTPHFFRCNCWSKEAEFVSTLDKGQAVSVIGKLVQNQWTDDKGNKNSQTLIAAIHTRKLDANKKESAEEIEDVTISEEIPDFTEIPHDEALF